MPAVFVNAAAVLVGSLAGILLKKRLRETMQSALMTAIALCTIVIGLLSALKTEDILCLILCMTAGTALGELCRIEEGIQRAGEKIQRRLSPREGGSRRFAEGFVSASILFCVGSMTITGSLEAGVHHDYSILLAKSAMDLVSSAAFGAAMGLGVTFSALFVLLFQGALTLLAGLLGTALSPEVVREMSAVGGVILLGIAVNLLGLREKPIRAANMLPAIFLPIFYIPVYHWLRGL